MTAERLQRVAASAASPQAVQEALITAFPPSQGSAKRAEKLKQFFSDVMPAGSGFKVRDPSAWHVSRNVKLKACLPKCAAASVISESVACRSLQHHEGLSSKFMPIRRCTSQHSRSSQLETLSKVSAACKEQNKLPERVLLLSWPVMNHLCPAG